MNGDTAAVDALDLDCTGRIVSFQDDATCNTEGGESQCAFTDAVTTAVDALDAEDTKDGDGTATSWGKPGFENSVGLFFEMSLELFDKHFMCWITEHAHYTLGDEPVLAQGGATVPQDAGEARGAGRAAQRLPRPGHADQGEVQLCERHQR